MLQGFIDNEVREIEFSLWKGVNFEWKNGTAKLQDFIRCPASTFQEAESGGTSLIVCVVRKLCMVILRS